MAEPSEKPGWLWPEEIDGYDWPEEIDYGTFIDDAGRLWHFPLTTNFTTLLEALAKATTSHGPQPERDWRWAVKDCDNRVFQDKRASLLSDGIARRIELWGCACASELQDESKRLALAQPSSHPLVRACARQWSARVLGTLAYRPCCDLWSAYYGQVGPDAKTIGAILNRRIATTPPEHPRRFDLEVIRALLTTGLLVAGMQIKAWTEYS